MLRTQPTNRMNQINWNIPTWKTSNDLKLFRSRHTHFYVSGEDDFQIFASADVVWREWHETKAVERIICLPFDTSRAFEAIFSQDFDLKIISASDFLQLKLWSPFNSFTIHEYFCSAIVNYSFARFWHVNCKKTITAEFLEQNKQ